MREAVHSTRTPLLRRGTCAGRIDRSRGGEAPPRPRGLQEGAYALIFKSSLFPGEAIAARRGSPLLLGIKQEPLSGEAINVLPSSPHTPMAVPSDWKPTVPVAAAGDTVAVKLTESP